MLLDTSGLLALLLGREPQHQQARTLFEQASQVLVHNYVLAEIVALANVRRIARSNLLDFLDALVGVPEVATIWVDALLHQRAVTLLRERADKSYSLCDAVSFLLMRDKKISRALTTDQHFAQEGFERLLQ